MYQLRITEVAYRVNVVILLFIIIIVQQEYHIFLILIKYIKITGE